jgi:hypothetical protein
MEATKSSRPGIPTERIILGIDPGTTVMGFGVLLVQNGKATLIEADAIRFSAGDDHTLRLREIFNHVLRIIEKHHPDELAIEAQFFGKNVQSMLKLGRAQGVAIAAALHRETRRGGVRTKADQAKHNRQRQRHQGASGRHAGQHFRKCENPEKHGCHRCYCSGIMPPFCTGQRSAAYQVRW